MRKSFSFFLLLVVAVAGFSQSTDSISIKKIDQREEYKRAYSHVIFQFAYLQTLKEIKAVGLNINDVRFVTDLLKGNGIIQTYLENKINYKVQVRYFIYEDSKVYQFQPDSRYDYLITIYLSPRKGPVAEEKPVDE